MDTMNVNIMDKLLLIGVDMQALKSTQKVLRLLYDNFDFLGYDEVQRKEFALVSSTLRLTISDCYSE